MKDEIKEILDDFKIYEDRYKKCNETQFIVFYRDIHLLLDYITNLKEELKSANESITWWQNRFNAIERDNKNYKSRCEKAIEYMQNYIEVEELNEPVKIELKEVMNILSGGDKE